MTNYDINSCSLHLSSYSLKLGASGSTFYDDAVTEFFSPHGSGKSAMIAIGVGIPDYRALSGEILVEGGLKSTGYSTSSSITQ
ncbi:MAG: hypothetical protein ACYC7D_12355 [Nitrososphaerales archaeon]